MDKREKKREKNYEFCLFQENFDKLSTGKLTFSNINQNITI